MFRGPLRRRRKSDECLAFWVGRAWKVRNVVVFYAVWRGRRINFLKCVKRHPQETPGLSLLSVRCIGSDYREYVDWHIPEK